MLNDRSTYWTLSRYLYHVVYAYSRKYAILPIRVRLCRCARASKCIVVTKTRLQALAYTYVYIRIRMLNHPSIEPPPRPPLNSITKINEMHILQSTNLLQRLHCSTRQESAGNKSRRTVPQIWPCSAAREAQFASQRTVRITWSSAVPIAAPKGTHRTQNSTHYTKFSSYLPSPSMGT